MQNPWVQNKVQQIIRATVLFSGYSALLSSIEVNSTWIFFWISKHLIPFAWDLLAFNVKDICISTVYDGTFVNYLRLAHVPECLYSRWK